MNQKQNRNQRLQMVVPYFKREKSVRTIARENNICKSSVEYWIKEFQKVQMEENRNNEEPIRASDFVEVTMSSENLKKQEVQMEVTLPNGIHIKIYQ